MAFSHTSSHSAAALLSGAAIVLLGGLVVLGRPLARESAELSPDGTVATPSPSLSAPWESDKPSTAAVPAEGIASARASASRFATALFAGEVEGIRAASTPALAAELSTSATGGEVAPPENEPRVVAIQTVAARSGWAHLQVLVERETASADGDEHVVDLVSVVVVRQGGRWLVADARF